MQKDGDQAECREFLPGIGHALRAARLHQQPLLFAEHHADAVDAE